MLYLFGQLSLQWIRSTSVALTLKLLSLQQVMRNYLKIIFSIIFSYTNDLFLLNFLSSRSCKSFNKKQTMCIKHSEEKCKTENSNVLQDWNTWLRIMHPFEITVSAICQIRLQYLNILLNR